MNIKNDAGESVGKSRRAYCSQLQNREFFEAIENLQAGDKYKKYDVELVRSASDGIQGRIEVICRNHATYPSRLTIELTAQELCVIAECMCPYPDPEDVREGTLSARRLKEEFQNAVGKDLYSDFLLHIRKGPYKRAIGYVFKTEEELKKEAGFQEKLKESTEEASQIISAPGQTMEMMQTNKNAV